MKKSKLLIPALSIASVGAVVAPMVTSCSGVSYDINLKDWKYDTTITKKTAADKYNNTTAPAAYYTEAIKDDYKILRNDIISTMMGDFESNDPELIIETYGGYLNNLKYEKAGTDADPYYLLSLDCGIRMKGHEKEESGAEREAEIKYTISIKGVVFKMMYVEESNSNDSKWDLELDPTATKALTTDWSMKIEMYANEGGNIMTSMQFADKAHPQCMSEEEGMQINYFDSPYFENVTYEK